MNREAAEAIAKMEAATNAFYRAAIAAGPHGFIEFTGVYLRADAALKPRFCTRVVHDSEGLVQRGSSRGIYGCCY